MRRYHVVFDRGVTIESAKKATEEAVRTFPDTQFIFRYDDLFGGNLDEVERLTHQRWFSRNNTTQLELGDFYDKLHYLARGELVLAIISKELYSKAHHMDWTLGYSSYGTIIVSTKSFEYLPDADFQRCLNHTVCHELGHMYWAAEGRKSDRGSIYDNHCANPNCCMHQEGNMNDIIALSQRTGTGKNHFCARCWNDIMGHFDVSKESQFVWASIERRKYWR